MTTHEARREAFVQAMMAAEEEVRDELDDLLDEADDVLTPEAAAFEELGRKLTAEYASSHGRPNELLEEEWEDELELEEWLPDDVWGLDYV